MTTKILKILALSGLFIVVLFSANSFLKSEREKRETEQFYTLVKISSDRSFDLRKYDIVDWDEVVFISPYTSFCEYGIEDYPDDKKNCRRSKDDGQSWLVFLKQNHIVSIVSVDRRIVDFTKININPFRIKHHRAIFQIEKEEVFPTPTLKN